ncbi:bcl-2-like protein 15 isoform X1 [Numida meleagris]|uniref:bcl-2-like protein 15 isoform X1 n=1 Tax=Numida meleagris TaxID=8996 RepID=UPI000B3D9FC8|nr:bcl-2-like protein 15 isoform X1 [Numida meleagris]
MRTFEEQTACVVEALFDDLLNDDETDFRCLQTDSGGSVQSEEESPSYFDPVIIANRLRQIGDQCNMDFERVSSQVLREVLMGQMEKFGAAVDALSRRWSDQNPELVYERAFLSVSVKLMMYILKKGAAQVNPSHLIKAINENVQVKNYIEACGGWEKLDN